MEVPIIKVLGCGQTVQKAHMSAVRMGPAEPESLAGGQWAIEFLVKRHSGGSKGMGLRASSRKDCRLELQLGLRQRVIRGKENLPAC